MGWGVEEGWLTNPEDNQVEIYQPNQAVKMLQTPSSVSGADMLPEFMLNLE
ncbi:Uma2 family endonuclease [Acaryochloris sp. CCMEE 5410]|uniref:Uma2 family endonuclease n=1 Tax=Acaryochloris sp. CCMEE 5410 TaxID=310037 RepID=UPI0002484853|nr:Uma2 family endonuclease [Acaryochloris sp. CCMEE 5410]